MSRIEAAITDDGEVSVECTLDAPPEKVWRALTVPELVADWLGVPPENGKESAATSHGYEIVEAEPFSRLRYRWLDGETDRPESYVTFELQPHEGGRTLFRLVHAGAAPALLPVNAANGNAPPLALAA